ncbi:MAG: hybrid sensor histidine kinase/response regulator [Cyanobacteria bacterium P01_D01_bin.156]
MSSASVMAVSQQVPEYFLQEASELLQQIDNELQTLRQAFSVQKMHRLMRAAHTLKGAAASVGLDAIQKTTHSLEDTFKALCAPDSILTSTVEGLIFDAYDCLQLLLSAQLTNAQIDESAVLDRMANVVVSLQENLGDQFGQDGYLPTSSELGFDMTQAIFEMGVAQRLETLENALKVPESEQLTSLLQSQADVFFGLAESLNLSGFGDIAQTTIKALENQPDKVVQIATIALKDYRAAQTSILQGDRAQGGAPSIALKKLAQQASSKVKTKIYQSKTLQKKSEGTFKTNWFRRIWLRFNKPVDNTPIVDNRLNPTSKSDSKNPEKNSTLRFSEQVKSTQLVSTQALDLGNQTETKSTLLEPAILNNQQSANSLEKAVLEPPISQLNHAPKENIELTQTIASIKESETLRVSVDHLERLNHVIGELLTQQSRQTLYNQNLTAATKTLLIRLEQQQKQLYKLQRQAIQPSTGGFLTEQKDTDLPFDALELEHYTQQQLLIQSTLDTVIQQRESTETIDVFLRQSYQALEKQHSLINACRETMLEVRMQPLSYLFQRFHQVLDRLSVQYSKPIDLQIQGGTVFADKTIVDKLYEPLLHLIRNAFDHGIETPEIRQQQNKPNQGQIKISAYHLGQQLVIKLQDDGKGLNLEAIGQKAVDNQLITPTEIHQLTSSQISNFIFEPELSTASQINELSGRGVGLDIVRAQIQSLGGQVTVAHQSGKGTCFTLKVPSKLTIAKLLLCRAGQQLYALMPDTVKQIVIPTTDQIKICNDRKILNLVIDGKKQRIFVTSLSATLAYNNLLPNPLATEASESTDAHPIILIHHRNRLVGLEIEQLMGEQELVIQSFNHFVKLPPHICGCSVLPDGSLSLVLDPTSLVLRFLKRISPHSNRAPQASTQLTAAKDLQGFSHLKPSILVVDDSITVRNTLTQELNKSGYQVLQAKDGSAALVQLKRAKIAAILCDLEMPGMNGFDFLKVRQKTPEIAAIPTIMLTSRTGDKHKQLAHELGATEYMTKPYLVPQMLQTLSNVLQTKLQENS